MEGEENKNKNNLKHKWTHNEIIRLIELFEERVDLWDVSLKNYSNKVHKDKLYTEIGEALGVNINEVVGKIHNLRCQYNGEIRKCKAKKSGSATDENYVTSWKYFNCLKFLSKRIGGPSQTTSNLSDYETESSTNSEKFEEKGSFRRKRKVDENFQKDVLLKSALNVMTKPTDSHQIFGDYVADVLRSMTKEKGIKLRKIFQRVIADMEEEDSTEENYPEYV